ncbi:MAG: hypothetical protein JWP87_4593 [Labilithrix sp.]|nr:hypothetical protein [Labilithrix sp.]
MKLDRLVSGAWFAAGLVALVTTAALASGCSNSVTPAKTASGDATAEARAAAAGNVTGTTNLMSAQIPGPAPKVGKAHLAVDESDPQLDSDTPAQTDADPPKEARRSDGSRRGGGFGSSK